MTVQVPPPTQLCPWLPDSKATLFTSEPVHLLLWLLNLLCTYPGLCQQNMPLLSAASSFSPQPICITLTYHPHGPHHLSTMLPCLLHPWSLGTALPQLLSSHLFPEGIRQLRACSPHLPTGITTSLLHQDVVAVLTKPTHLCFLCIYMHMCEISMVTGLFFFLFLVESPTAPPSALEK